MQISLCCSLLSLVEAHTEEEWLAISDLGQRSRVYRVLVDIYRIIDKLIIESHRPGLPKIKMANDEIATIKNAMKTFKDFPKPGILFYDMMPILGDVAKFRLLIKILTDRIKEIKCDVIIGLDARGFLIGPPCALELGLPFVPIRKVGKLPGEVHQATYELEYGKDVIELQKDSIKPGQRVVIIDDLLATGGTMSAACQLVHDSGAEVVLVLVISHLADLKGTDKLPKDTPFHTLITL